MQNISLRFVDLAVDRLAAGDYFYRNFFLITLNLSPWAFLTNKKVVAFGDQKIQHIAEEKPMYPHPAPQLRLSRD